MQLSQTAHCDVTPKPADCEAEAVAPEQECRTSRVVDDISKCMLEKSGCKHAFPFGHSLFCNHPQHKELRKRHA